MNGPQTPNADESPDKPGAGILWAIIVAEALLLLVLVFGDIGFDHKGRFGLDIGHFVVIAFIYCCLFVSGFLFAILLKQSKFIALQVGLLAIAVLLGALFM